MIRRDALSPSSGADYVGQLELLVRRLTIAQRDLSVAWGRCNDVRWNHGAELANRRPDDDPDVVQAEAAVEEARERWRNAHLALEYFICRGLKLRCGVENWKARPFPGDYCLLPGDHTGPHSFELEPPL